ncbi:MAG: beta-galactosidase, partial [Calditrichaceae bacterium]
MNKLVLQCILYFVCSTLFGQPYKIDANIAPKTIMDGHLKMGHPGPAGKEILINNRYLSIGGKPIIPVMGEFHFSRYPRAQWEDIILKMKANCIDIIACYVIWIHHE